VQRVAVCCSVLQCVAACCSVLQRVAVCCSVLQCVAACCSVWSSERTFENLHLNDDIKVNRREASSGTNSQKSDL